MGKVPLRRLLSKLTALALTASPAAAVAGPATPTAARDVDSDLDGDLAGDLSIDREHMDPRDAAATLGRSLALALSELRPLAGTHLATTWALADDPVRRLAVAHSLEWAFPLFGDMAILDHLSYDTDPAIRTAVARAAWVRRRSSGDMGVLARLAHDPDPDVSAIARHAIE